MRLKFDSFCLLCDSIFHRRCSYTHNLIWCINQKLISQSSRGWALTRNNYTILFSISCVFNSIHHQPWLSLSSIFSPVLCCFFSPRCPVSFLYASLAVLPYHPLLFLCCPLSQFPSVHCFPTAPSAHSLYLCSPLTKLPNPFSPCLDTDL